MTRDESFLYNIPHVRLCIRYCSITRLRQDRVRCHLRLYYNGFNFANIIYRKRGTMRTSLGSKPNPGRRIKSSHYLVNYALAVLYTLRYNTYI